MEVLSKLHLKKFTELGWCAVVEEKFGVLKTTRDELNTNASVVGHYFLRQKEIEIDIIAKIM